MTAEQRATTVATEETNSANEAIEQLAQIVICLANRPYVAGEGSLADNGDGTYTYSLTYGKPGAIGRRRRRRAQERGE